MNTDERMIEIQGIQEISMEILQAANHTIDQCERTGSDSGGFAYNRPDVAKKTGEADFRASAFFLRRVEGSRWKLHR